MRHSSNSPEVQQYKNIIPIMRTIRISRLRLDMSIVKLSELSGINVNIIANIENYQKTPDVETLLVLLNILKKEELRS